jgi:NADPH:quinone reductase-like Zn-dependent oxidoreductase
MHVITVRDRNAGLAGMSRPDMPYPHAAENDVIVRVHAAGFTPGELDWLATWTDRAGRDRTPSVPGHELSGVVVELGQGLFDHGHLTTGQTVLIHGAAGGGSIAVQLAREAGARVIGSGRASDRDTALALGVDTFIDLQTEKLEDADEADVVFDVIGGDTLDRSAALVRAGGTLVTIVMPPKVQPKDGWAVFFVVEPDRARLTDLATRLREGRLRPVVGAVRPLARGTRRARPRQTHPRQDDHPRRGRLNQETHRDRNAERH